MYLCAAGRGRQRARVAPGDRRQGMTTRLVVQSGFSSISLRNHHKTNWECSSLPGHKHERGERNCSRTDDVCICMVVGALLHVCCNAYERLVYVGLIYC